MGSTIKRNAKFNYRAILGDNNPLKKYPQLYEAAVDEFSRKDYEEASLNDILRNANMSKSSLYHHFGDKFGLYLATLDIIYKKKIDYFTPILKERQPDGDFFNTMRNLSRDTMEFMFRDERLYHFSNMTLRSGQELMDLIHEYFPYDFQGSFGGLIEASIKSGQISSRYSPDFLAGLIGIIFSNFDKLLDTSNSEAAMESLELVFEVLENGIKER